VFEKPMSVLNKHSSARRRVFGFSTQRDRLTGQDDPSRATSLIPRFEGKRLTIGAVDGVAGF
jgi:hypothetical protein